MIFSASSLEHLKQVHPDLVKVVVATLATGKMNFAIIQGARTLAQQQALYAQGRTAPGKIVTWIDPTKGKHLIQPDGYGHAVDLAPLPIDWHNLEAFEDLADLMIDTAGALGISILWGGDWEENKDYPHFELASSSPKS